MNPQWYITAIKDFSQTCEDLRTFAHSQLQCSAAILEPTYLEGLLVACPYLIAQLVSLRMAAQKNDCDTQQESADPHTASTELPNHR